MAKIRREAVVHLSIEQVWEFIADMNGWAHDLPGYCSHEMKSDTESIWRLRGELGPLNREVDLKVLVTEWVERSGVTFTVDGVHEPVKGGGKFSVTVGGPTETTLTFEMALEAKGLMAPVINPLLGKMAPGMCDQFIAALFADMLKGKVEVSAVSDGPITAALATATPEGALGPK